MSAPPVIVLHVGTMKSGTTYLQSRLEHHRERLAADGVLFPGPRWKDQLRAVGDALDRSRHETDLSSGSGRWARMRAQMLAWTGSRIVLSVEHLSRASRTQARAILASLAPADVEIVVTARDLGRDIPSAWQQDVKAGSSESFEAFLRALERPDAWAADPGAAAGETPVAADPVAVLARRFWRRHDAASLAHRWADPVGSHRVTVVTVPPAGCAPDVLWQRFSAAAGLDPSRYPAVGDDLPLNPSLGVAGAELVRRLNERLGDKVAQGPHRDLVKFTVANSTLAGRTDDPLLQVPAPHRDWVTDRAFSTVARLRSAGVRVVGDLDDLVPAATRSGGDDMGEVPARAMAAAAVRATAALLLQATDADHPSAPGDGGGRGRAGSRAGSDAGDRGSGRRRSVLAEHESAAQRRAARDETPYDRTLDPPGSMAAAPG